MSVEGKFLSKEINDLFWRGPDTRYCRELHGRKWRPLLQPLPEVHNSLKVELSPIPTK